MDSLLKIYSLPFHPEIYDAAAPATGETMPVVFFCIHRKTKLMVVVKGAKPATRS
jgi:hypothetical protein